MAFVVFDEALVRNCPIIINVDRIDYAVPHGVGVRLAMTNGDHIYVRGSFDEVVARIADAADVYVDEAEEPWCTSDAEPPADMHHEKASVG